uniref:Uncharacterized protein n=1 Tax=Prevotella sp. GTC17259 TaxID=3236795 RepID=A0AB33J4B8_9BACT
MKNLFTSMMLSLVLSLYGLPALATAGLQSAGQKLNDKEQSAFLALMNVFHVQQESFYILIGSEVYANGDSCAISYRKLGCPMNDMLVEQKKLALKGGQVVFGDLMRRRCQMEYNEKQQVARMVFDAPAGSKVVEIVEFTYDEQGRPTMIKDVYEAVGKQKQAIFSTKSISYSGQENFTLEYLSYSRMDAMKLKQKDVFSISKLTFGKDDSENKYWYERWSKSFSVNETKGSYTYDDERRLVKQIGSRLAQQKWLSTETRYGYHGQTHISTEEIKYSEEGISERSVALLYKVDKATGKLVDLGDDEVRCTVYDKDGNAKAEFKAHGYREKVNGVWSDWLHYQY